MNQFNNLSLPGKLIVIAAAVIVGFMVLNVVMSILKALVGLAIFIVLIAGVVWLFGKLRG